jgi:hypothetical protein
MENAGWVVDVVLQGDTPRTKTTLGHGVVFITLNFLQAAILVYIQFETTTHRVASRGRPGTTSSNSIPLVLVAPILTEIIDLAQGGQRDYFCPFIEIIRHELLLTKRILGYP